MKKEDLLEKAKDPKFITGIYNYCDRWCERCRFTDRCLNYASSEKKDREASAPGPDNEAFWKEISESLQLAVELLEDMAAQQGIDLEALEDEEKSARENVVHILSPMSKAYYEKVNHWFAENESFLSDAVFEQETKPPLRIVSSEPGKPAMPIQEIIEVVRWYQYQIHAKLMRAVEGKADEASLGLDDFPKDSDGSAKVALIGIDRSMGAWLELEKHSRTTTGSIIPVIQTLRRLKQMTEKEFPTARAFIRPGFDE